jgi:hypothetical protein
MPTKVLQRFTAWSISRLRDYERCPYYAKEVHLNKRRGPGSPAMDRGAEIHRHAELYLKKKTKVLMPELSSFKKEFAELKKSNLGSEIKWAFDNEWKHLPDESPSRLGFFHHKAWLRIVADAARKIFIRKKPAIDLIDFKTGKHSEGRVSEYNDQLELYAPTTFIVYPKVEMVRGSLWFTDAGVIEKTEYARKDLPKLIDKWNERVAPMLADTKFAPRPGHYCSFCHLSKRNGGPCRF